MAFQKEAFQSGEWDGLSPDRAVDGQLSSDSDEYCAHPQNERNEPAWFFVDLGGLHRIINVTVFNTYNTGGN